MNRDPRALRACRALLLATLILLASAAAAAAQPITVNVPTDPSGAGACLTGGDCSLRQAVTAATSGDTIVLGANTYSLTQGTDIIVTKSLTFQGVGAGSTKIDGSQNSGTSQPGSSTRILRVEPAATVTVHGLTFASGSDANDETCADGCNTLDSTGGGALFNNGGSVSLDDVAFTNNSAPIGGAISNGPGGTLTMTDVSFTSNGAAFGGGLFSRGGQVTGTGVTFENNGNGGFGGGAAFLTGGTVSLLNATIVGNGWASTFGGGIVNAAANLTLINDTFSGNLRGALETDSGSTAVANTIIGAGFSDNVDFACIAPGKRNSAGYTSSPAISTDRGNNIDEDGHCGLSGTGDMSNVDARLAPIFDNTGPTRTEALLSDSPALGDPASSDFCPATDQRGIARPNGRCDIGAFEAVIEGAPSTPNTDAPRNVTETSADFAATINLNSEAGGFHFMFGPSSDPATWTATPEAAAGVLSSDTPVTETITGLNPGTTYYYTAVADNASNSTPSENVQHFTTPPGAPVISNVSVDSVTDTTATIDFTVDPQGSDTTYVVNYGPDAGYGNETPTPAGDAGSVTGPKQETVTLTNLSPSSAIHFQVVAGNAVQQGVASGDEILTTDEQIDGVPGGPLQVNDANANAFDCPATATIDWGDGNTDEGVPVDCISPGGEENYASYRLSTVHTYGAAGHYPIVISYDNGDQSNLFAQISQGSSNPPQYFNSPPPATPPPPAPPSVSGGAPTSKTSDGASVSGSVNPEGTATQAFFQYGIDLSQRGPGASTVLYDQSTPVQLVAADQASHSVSAPLTGLVPGALYHVRLVAINAAGKTFGPDQTFTTAAAPAPPPPVLGHSEDVKPVSGTVFIKTASGQFIPLTGATQIPTGSVIDALHGSLQIVAAIGKGKTEHGIFGGAIFKLVQAKTGLTTLSLIESAFQGAPSYATCKVHKAGEASAAALSSKTLQILHASAHGKFRTSGRYSAATVRGTIWTVADRCDGTLTHDVTDSVLVNDFVHHKAIVLRAGQSYLARARG